MAERDPVETWDAFLDHPAYRAVFGDRNDSVLRRGMFLARPPLAALAAVVFAFVFWSVATCGAQVGIGVRLLYALWTVGIPLYFFVETIYGVDPAKSKDEAKMKTFKATQDAARPVWIACAAALGVLLLK
jgi:hypothetical protein